MRCRTPRSHSGSASGPFPKGLGPAVAARSCIQPWRRTDDCPHSAVAARSHPRRGRPVPGMGGDDRVHAASRDAAQGSNTLAAGNNEPAGIRSAAPQYVWMMRRMARHAPAPGRRAAGPPRPSRAGTPAGIGSPGNGREESEERTAGANSLLSSLPSFLAVRHSPLPDRKAPVRLGNLLPASYLDLRQGPEFGGVQYG